MVTFPSFAGRQCICIIAARMKKITVGRGEDSHPAIALFVFAVACAMTFSEVSAQVATFTTQQYPLLGNTHIAADLNGDGKPDLAGAGANVVSVMLGKVTGRSARKPIFLSESRRRRWPPVISTATAKWIWWLR